MKPYRFCACRNPETGRLFGIKCPDLRKKNHGKWYARYEVPPAPDGSRRRRRVGPYDTEKAAKDAVVEALAQVAATGHNDDRRLKLGTYLGQWHADRVSEYYSCCFSVCDCAAAQRGSLFRGDGYWVSPPSGRRGSGGEGCQAGGVVVPAGAGLVASAPGGPAELEGEAGWA